MLRTISPHVYFKLTQKLNFVTVTLSVATLSDYILDVSTLIPNKSYRLIGNCGYFSRDVQFVCLLGSSVPGIMMAKFYDPAKKEYHYISNNNIWADDNPVRIRAL